MKCLTSSRALTHALDWLRDNGSPYSFSLFKGLLYIQNSEQSTHIYCTAIDSTHVNVSVAFETIAELRRLLNKIPPQSIVLNFSENHIAVENVEVH